MAKPTKARQKVIQAKVNSMGLHILTLYTQLKKKVLNEKEFAQLVSMTIEEIAQELPELAEGLRSAEEVIDRLRSEE